MFIAVADPCLKTRFFSSKTYTVIFKNKQSLYHKAGAITPFNNECA